MTITRVGVTGAATDGCHPLFLQKISRPI